MSGEYTGPTWGPYLSDRQWGTVREDYSENGTAWNYFPHDHARSRAYRWGEDGIGGVSDDQQILCFAPTFWNGKDPILKERLFGLNNEEGNHGEDVKELYYYLENTPDHSWMRCLYKYAQTAFPYEHLLRENAARTKAQPEFELLDTGIFDSSDYFDIYIDYAKNKDEDLLIRISVENRSANSARLFVLPTLWFRNQWSFGLIKHKPSITAVPKSAGQPGQTFSSVLASHYSLGEYYLYFENTNRQWYTENETNNEKLYGIPSEGKRVKDAFHTALLTNEDLDLGMETQGTKFAPVFELTLAPKGKAELRLRLTRDKLEDPLGHHFTDIMLRRKSASDTLYKTLYQNDARPDLEKIFKQALSGLLWNKQFYYYTVERWLDGDPHLPKPPEQRKTGRNANWKTLNNRDILSMPDKWEYPWYASWDLAFHTLPLSFIDPGFAKEQLITITREWYMHPDGQLPAYEWNFNDTNPPLEAWAALRIYQIEKQNFGKNDADFLKRVFHKLMINFTWWVNKKDVQGLNIFEGGFLGLDNIGIFDRSAPIPGGAVLEQADGTAWMATYALNMLDIALELARLDPVYEDVASKFYEHFLYIAESYNQEWNEDDHFFYDMLLKPNGEKIPIKVRSLVGVISTFAVSILKNDLLSKLDSFRERMQWFSTYRKNTHQYLAQDDTDLSGDYFLSLVSRNRLTELLQVLLDEKEFLSPYGLRSVSRYYLDKPYHLNIDGMDYSIDYEPAEASSYLFGGNSNWRGPIWMPLNFLFIETLRKYHLYYGDTIKVECPTGSGVSMNLFQVAQVITDRIVSIFTRDAGGNRPLYGPYNAYYKQEGWEDLILFHEYFDGETGKGLGASHQTGWTALIAGLCRIFEKPNPA